MERPSNRSYALRGNRPTRAQALAMQTQWANFSLQVESEIKINDLFPDLNQVILEIGSGMGEATAEIAEHFPNTGFVAVEMHYPGLGALLMLVSEKRLQNIKLIREDATHLLNNFIPNDSIDAVHLFFPDPWPKNRQHKRRIVQDEFVELIASKLKPGGYIHVATDWQPYTDWIKERFDGNQRFSGGVIQRPDWRPISKFEGQGLKKGHAVTDLKYEKIK
jgi:tRNA (guanine-N7-)-methyltransferase